MSSFLCVCFWIPRPYFLEWAGKKHSWSVCIIETNMIDLPLIYSPLFVNAFLFIYLFVLNFYLFSNLYNQRYVFKY